MKPPTRIAMRLAHTRVVCTPQTRPMGTVAARQLHKTRSTPATVSSIHGTAPPPDPPVPSADDAAVRLERRKRQAALLASAQDIRAAHNKSSSRANTTAGTKTAAEPKPLRKRFWKDVFVREVDGAWEVHLDARPLRHPTTKKIVRLPLSKPLLAAALAHEWDAITSAQQATKQHLIPLTSLACRALDIADDDAAAGRAQAAFSASGYVRESLRAGIAAVVMRYFDTDTLLCWAPPPEPVDAAAGVESLHDVQRRRAGDVCGFLAARVWPGVEIVPVIDGEGIMPRDQPPGTRDVIQGWVMGLDPWELAGLERAALAGKGLLGAVRLVVEWSEGPAGTGGSGGEGEAGFGTEEAANLASLEVDWQTRKWGEVEDTHDVEKEDLRRQLASAVLLVSGTGGK